MILASRRTNLNGKSFSYWSIIKQGPSLKHKTFWVCRCRCGVEKTVETGTLIQGKSKSCGCIKITHGQSRGYKRTPELKLLDGAKRRSRNDGVPFDITLADIKIPEMCPILGIPLYSSKGKMTNNSPSLDRIDSTKGYVKGNIQVISIKANRVKNDASFEDIEKMYVWYKNRKS